MRARPEDCGAAGQAACRILRASLMADNILVPENCGIRDMLYREYVCADASALNTRLLERFIELAETDRVRQTHFYAGRFENIYLDVTDIPELATVLGLFRQQAGQWLNTEPARLRTGFWFNAMGPGHITSAHHHDENDELLSAAYYVRVPENSGDLVLYDQDETVRIKPQEGRLVMFPPSLMHEVTVNNSRELRLSVGMNIGPLA